MKVILLKTVEQLGKPFDIVAVKDGYARNFLIPRNLAIVATESNLRGLEKTKRRFSKKVEQLRKVSMEMSERIANTTIKTTIRIGIDGKSFGSITSQHIVNLLQSEGIEVDKKHIVLDEPIKQPGVYDVKIHLGEKVDSSFKLIVIEEGD